MKMRLCRSLLIFSLVLEIQGCMQTQYYSTNNNNAQSEFTIVPAMKDSVPVSDSTKYFYRYVFGDISKWDITPEWALGNLDHFGIVVNEAWYYGGASHTDFGNGAYGKTMVSPSIVVGLSRQNSEILNHHFEPMEYFDPLGHPNGPNSGFTHYVIRQIHNLNKEN